MNKGIRYLLAFIACAAIFALWVIFQVYVANGILIGIVFCAAMVGVWKAIVKSNGEDNGKSEE